MSRRYTVDDICKLDVCWSRGAVETRFDTRKSLTLRDILEEDIYDSKAVWVALKLAPLWMLQQLAVWHYNDPSLAKLGKCQLGAVLANRSWISCSDRNCWCHSAAGMLWDLYDPEDVRDLLYAMVCEG